MASMLSLCCSSEWSGSTLLSMLQSALSPLLSPFTSTTSQWLLDASVLHDDSDAAASLPSSSASGLAAPSRFSLLLESRCLLPSWGRRRRPGLRPPLPVFGLLEGLLVRLREGADFLLEAGEAVGKPQGETHFLCGRTANQTHTLHVSVKRGGARVKSTCGTFGKVAEASGGRDGGQVVLSNPQQILALAAGVEAVLLQVPGSQEGAGVEVFPGELDDLLGFDPAAVHKLEAL